MLDSIAGAPATSGVVSASPTTLDRIGDFREMYRLEMSCQIVHDSIHDRAGWTREYLLAIGETAVGYGSVAVGGPWTAEPTAYEFYVVPTERLRVFELFGALLDASGATHIEVQSNAVLALAMLHTFAAPVTSDAILFQDATRTTHAPPDATFREPAESEAPDVPAECRRWRGVVEVDGVVAASGGILFHYNRPFGDIYMEVAEPYRRRGLGSFLVQELKRVCYEGGHVPAVRCSPANIASRQTLQKAGFVPCGHILKGPVSVVAAGSTPGAATG
jgi:GNAT superfamily N-acetyltransferase